MTSLCGNVVMLSFLLCCHVRAHELMSDAHRVIDRETEQRCQYYLTELQSGGNVKLTQCDPDQACFRACSELLHSRFSVAEVHATEVKVLHGVEVTGIEVLEVTRLENRLLFNRYIYSYCVQWKPLV